MSIDSIDKAIYDKERYESLRKRGVSEDRAKRVSTVPLHPRRSDLLQDSARFPATENPNPIQDESRATMHMPPTANRP